MTTINESPAFNIVLPEFTGRGACADSELPPDTWQIEEKDRGYQETVKLARAVCRKCPIRVECLTHAIVQKEPVGVWGGLTVRQRGKLVQK